ncbi:bacteriocin immunity protein [Pseudomonas citronellolis]|uniref:bacteriocin immunity protein n=1 Tax=Pseudomonas citronellolis TaxID=53408 RepID=UPI0023E3941A|nr:bacteriocin immunity protein [Pseudomonas citronellolis]MDF3936723.1 bacteriocin immunity protein [Pseudomonas citronellolis]
MKTDITEFTEDEFITFMKEILIANKYPTDDVLDVLLERFCKITGHPDGTDLIYYPEDGSSGSAEDVMRTVKTWRAANGLPGFKAG